MTGRPFKASFLDSDGRRIFVLLRAPADATNCVLLVPPFAEEMNKSRRQFSLAAERLIEAGFGVLLPDLYGTGDSEGDFADADWRAWMADLRNVCDWAEDCCGLRVSSMLALRLGCVLAAEAFGGGARRLEKSVFWQPVDDGNRYLNQFLRLRVAASMMDDDRRETVDGLRSRIEAGDTLEIAGYPVSQRLGQAIGNARLLPHLGANLGDLHVLEVGRSSESRLSAVGQRIAEAARKSGAVVEGLRVPGEPFWSSTEIVVNRPLLDETLARIGGSTH